MPTPGAKVPDEVAAAILQASATMAARMANSNSPAEIAQEQDRFVGTLIDQYKKWFDRA
jgi:hypothetical protein